MLRSRSVFRTVFLKQTTNEENNLFLLAMVELELIRIIDNMSEFIMNTNFNKVFFLPEVIWLLYSNVIFLHGWKLWNDHTLWRFWKYILTYQNVKKSDRNYGDGVLRTSSTQCFNVVDSFQNISSLFRYSLISLAKWK